MPDASNMSSVSHLIDLALAPAFLLVGVGSLLNVLSVRLGRVVDRARILEESWSGGGASSQDRTRLKQELLTLDRRMAAVHWAITLCTAAALFVCMLIATLFIGHTANIPTAIAVPALFILAMGLLIVGLSLFLVEVYLATRSVRVSRDLIH